MLRTTPNKHAQKRAPKGRIALAVVTIGATFAGGQAVLMADSAAHADSNIAFASANASLDSPAFAATSDSNSPSGTVQVLNVTRALDPSSYAQQLATSKRFSDERAAREAEMRRPVAALPVIGVLTSTFGQRWGTLHGGIDIAAPIGTPIVAVADGEVIDSGPAAGFGLWVRIRHDDGTVTVYGHNDTNIAQVGDRVHAGQQIATVGNRGFSTGPHVHFEVWIGGDNKIDPIGWLADLGIDVFGGRG
ncbi:M23 family metallopeptidase [Hoyosella subflava]|uniref:Possible lipoprotein n=1 Tax=Hoyosella subflava (strain DSM 45089 / JCM 17490 / NBRC 109087 / DQS3-9A1) TaxID=443218 RepID=F6ERE4_HOYSD|nr:M23 family metallopeptidase [Hoyosella subflava]AEF42022.1 Possible lipoprotein [Hoyosella subflava DQS3-9A1]